MSFACPLWLWQVFLRNCGFWLLRKVGVSHEFWKAETFCREYWANSSLLLMWSVHFVCEFQQVCCLFVLSDLRGCLLIWRRNSGTWYNCMLQHRSIIHHVTQQGTILVFHFSVTFSYQPMWNAWAVNSSPPKPWALCWWVRLTHRGDKDSCQSN